MSSLHPYFAERFAAMQKAGRPPLHQMSCDQARRAMTDGTAMLGAARALPVQSTIVVPTRSGSIPALLVRPSDHVDGIMVFLHGGGWALGAAADYAVLAAELAFLSNIAVVVPDYRLAPEYPFPSALEDSLDAIRHVAANVELLAPGAPSGALLLAGDSAGGNLAAVASIELASEISIALQILIYPVADCDFATDSYRRYFNQPPLQGRDMQWFFGHYADRDDWRSPRISLLHSGELSSSPPTFICVAAMDVLRDEGIALGHALAARGVDVSLHEYASMPHGFIRFHEMTDVASGAVGDMVSAVRTALETASEEQSA